MIERGIRERQKMRKRIRKRILGNDKTIEAVN